MNITRYEPSRFFSNLNNDFNRVLAMRNQWPWTLRETDFASTEWAPPVDIKETDHHFEVRIDVPGVDPKDIDVSMENGLLKIAGL